MEILGSVPSPLSSTSELTEGSPSFGIQPVPGLRLSTWLSPWRFSHGRVISSSLFFAALNAWLAYASTWLDVSSRSRHCFVFHSGVLASRSRILFSRNRSRGMTEIFTFDGRIHMFRFGGVRESFDTFSETSLLCQSCGRCFSASLCLAVRELVILLDVACVLTMECNAGIATFGAHHLRRSGATDIQMSHLFLWISEPRFFPPLPGTTLRDELCFSRSQTRSGPDCLVTSANEEPAIEMKRKPLSATQRKQSPQE
jgi:hypothetical protein